MVKAVECLDSKILASDPAIHEIFAREKKKRVQFLVNVSVNEPMIRLLVRRNFQSALKFSNVSVK